MFPIIRQFYNSSPCLSGQIPRPASWGWDPGNWFPVIEGVLTLSPNEAYQSQSADNADITVISTISVDDATQAQTADQPILILDLAGTDAFHSQSSDQAAISQITGLTPDDASQAQTAELAVLVVTISIDDAVHTHTAEIAPLGGAVAPDECYQDQTSDTATLSVTMFIDDSMHLHTASSGILQTSWDLSCYDCFQAIESDTPEITEDVAMTLLDIYNIALGMVGHDTIDSTSDTTKAGRMLNLLWPQVRQTVLRAFPWNTAKKRIILDTPDSTAPVFGWTYRFALPSDCLRVLGREDEDNPWTVEGRYLYTDTDSVSMLYIADVTDVASYDSLMTEAMCVYLAARLALPLAASASLAQVLAADFERVLGMARHVSSTEGTPPRTITKDWREG